MKFSKLSKNVKEAILKLPKDQTFQKIFSEDKILDELEAEKVDRSMEFLVSNALLNEKFAYKNYKFNQISPLMIYRLWIFKSSFLTGKVPSIEDIDLFFYLLDNPEEISEYNGTIKKYDLSKEELILISLKLLEIAFYHLRFFPKGNKNDEKGETYFDQFWLSSLVSCVQQITNLKPEEIYKQSLCSAYSYYVQFAVQNSSIKNIGRRTPTELVYEIDRRSCELIVDYLIEKRVIDLKDRLKYIEEMSIKEI